VAFEGSEVRVQGGGLGTGFRFEGSGFRFGVESLRFMGWGSGFRAQGLPQTTEDPMWGHPMPVLGALSPFLEPFRGHLSPKVDEIFPK